TSQGRSPRGLGRICGTQWQSPAISSTSTKQARGSGPEGGGHRRGRGRNSGAPERHVRGGAGEQPQVDRLCRWPDATISDSDHARRSDSHRAFSIRPDPRAGRLQVSGLGRTTYPSIHVGDGDVSRWQTRGDLSRLARGRLRAYRSPAGAEPSPSCTPPRPARRVTRPLLVVDAANVVGMVPDGWWRRRAEATELLR